ncbi:UNVERIFIED_CONTAM: hypothetical protein PYX00_006532 [Menopon gallinae]|uniref:Probable glycerol kinase n=1 Tax=Menopon gallinae TaxID=328185 RepID=A0AAW2HWR6_9NEOP
MNFKAKDPYLLLEDENMYRRKRYGKFGPIVGAIDEGTSSARFLAFAAETSEVLTFHQIEITQICPQEGWVEQDPMEILGAVRECIERTTDNLKKLDIDPNDMVAIGITNQRETTILWDKFTGKPLHNAIVWLDIRTSTTVDEVLKKVKNRNPEFLKPLCGLPISTYFSALKIKWLMDNVEEVRAAIREDRCLFGTIDSWLIWNFTGGVDGGYHITDVTNASRTMLMNISTLKWDSRLCDFFGIPMSILPKIYSSSEIYGFFSDEVLVGVPISGCLGDQQSALVGQMCFKQGQAKNTYGTGCFLLYNTGTLIVRSEHGLLTTVAYKLGRNAPPVYALEGSVAIAGAAMKWLRENLQLFENERDAKKLSEQCQTFSDVYFVPAFSGLYAPYWRKDARSVICGLTEGTSKHHIVKAAIEAVCFQTRDILEAMNKDCGIPLQKLLVDGGMTVNNYIMQLQADLCGISVVRPTMTETTALGAAMMAGMAEGIKVWDLVNTPKVVYDVFRPTLSDDERDVRYRKWKMAIDRSLNWDTGAKEVERVKKYNLKQASVAPALFVIISVGLLICAKYWN